MTVESNQGWHESRIPANDVLEEWVACQDFNVISAEVNGSIVSLLVDNGKHKLWVSFFSDFKTPLHFLNILRNTQASLKIYFVPHLCVIRLDLHRVITGTKRSSINICTIADEESSIVAINAWQSVDPDPNWWWTPLWIPLYCDEKWQGTWTYW